MRSLLQVLMKAPVLAGSMMDVVTSPTRSHALSWLINLGGLGVFALALLDSSVLPIPLPGSTDLVLLLLTAFRSRSISSPIMFASCAFAGSSIGGYTAWAAGKKGGEAALDRLGKGRFVRKIQGWVKRNGVLSVALASMLPPPVPLMPFLVAAGALGLSRGRFFISYSIGRMLRYGAVAWLGYKYGRQAIQLWQKDLRGWSTPIIVAYISLILVGALWGIWKYRQAKREGK